MTVKSGISLEPLKKIYEEKRMLFIIPLILLILAIAQIGYQTATTGEFIIKDVSLKGGMTVTIPLDREIRGNVLEDFLTSNYPDVGTDVRTLTAGGEMRGVIITADINVDDTERASQFLSDLSELTGINRDEFSVEFMGSSLGTSFFHETFKAIIMAFILMGAIVLLYFGESWKHKTIAIIVSLGLVLLVRSSDTTIMYIISLVIGLALIGFYLRFSVPSFAVVFAAFSDIVITVAIVNLLGIKVSTAGIAAFLMLIGYSVDTNILLSTRLIKRKDGTIMERVYNAMKTGLTMSTTTIVALTVAIIFSQSAVISQIMTIVLIGLLVDIVNTWIMNVSILRMYLERRK